MVRMSLILLFALIYGCEDTRDGKSANKRSDLPNIVIFLTDDLGYGDLGVYGHPIIKTPFIDQFANEGVRLTDCHSGGTVCSPSRSALLTGRNPYRSGFFYIAGRNAYLRNEEFTIAESLKTRGYETSFWGKWHLSMLEKEKRDEPGPNEQGFDYSFASTVNAFDGPENYTKFLRNGSPVGEVDGWYCDVLVREAGNWLKNERDREKPFFMIVSTHEPHTPIAPPEEYSAIYDNIEVDTLEKDIQYGGVARPKADISENKKEYYGTVTQLDAAFGRLMQSLDELDLRDNTIVIFTSDNGPETPVTIEESLGEWEDPIRDYCFGTPGDLRGMKRFPYEGGHRVPGIVRFPGTIPAGTVSDKLINGIDWFPTLASLADARIPSDRPIDGINAFNALLNKELVRSKASIWFYPNHEDTYFRMPQAAVRKDKYTLIGHLPKKTSTENLRTWMAQNDPESFELYDLKEDPSQSKDISIENPALVTSMKAEMITLWREMRDEGLSGEVGNLLKN